MITVNLLPYYLRPINRTPLPHMASVLVLFAVLGLIAVSLMADWAELAGREEELAARKNELAGLQKYVDEEAALQAKKVELQTKVEVIEEILRNRIVWSEWLCKLTRLTPDKYWYSRIREQQKSFMEPVKQLDGQGNPVKGPDGKDKYSYKPVFRPVLEVSGYAIPDDGASRGINPLTERISNDAEFSERFELMQVTLKDEDFDGFAVRTFTVPFKIHYPGDVKEKN